MGTLSSRIKAFLAAPTDVVDVATDLTGPLGLIDGEIGMPVVPNGGGLPGTPYDGQVRVDMNDGFMKYYSAAALGWKLIGPISVNNQQGSGGGWKSISPTLNAITLGTPGAFNVLDYIRLPGNLIYWRWKLVLGTGGAVTGTAGFLLPVEFPIDVSANVQAWIAEDAIGYGKVGLTAGAASRHTVTAGLISVAAPGQVFFTINDTGNPVNGSGTNPFAWAAGGAILAQGTYRTSAV